MTEIDPKDLTIAFLEGVLGDIMDDNRKKAEWSANTESRRTRIGRWEFYRDKRDWWVGVFLFERGTYFGFLTLIAKRNLW